MGTVVNIIMCTYNGGRFLEQQILSILNQTYENRRLFISDDGSTDDTLEIIRKITATHGLSKDKVCLITGPGQGSTSNFLSLFQRAFASGTAASEYFAFSDQDDIWEETRLERAVAWLQSVPDDRPALYGSRTLLVDENNLPLSTMPARKKPLTFSNALVENYTSGNTMLFNAPAARLINESLKGVDLNLIPNHDWWFYLILSGVGARVFLDDYPGVRYRQHGANCIGVKRGIPRLLARLRRLAATRDGLNIGKMVALLQSKGGLLSDTNRVVLSEFMQARNSGIFYRIRYALSDNIYRLSTIDTFIIKLLFIMRAI